MLKDLIAFYMECEEMTEEEATIVATVELSDKGGENYDF